MNELPQIDACKSDEWPSINLTVADRIDLICDAYEEAWLSGDSPQIEEFLRRCDESERDLLLSELLLIDRELRITSGEIASRQQYQRRFPNYSTLIDSLEFPTIGDRGRNKSGPIQSAAFAVVGTKLAHFELVGELGSGASGTVWKAKDCRLQRTVAIKIPRQCSMTGDERARFLREGQACAQLQHSNIVAVYEVGEFQGLAFIISEFIEGPNLRERLKTYQPQPREAAEFAAQVAEALHHAHEQGVVHRDLKPANILIDCEGRPHITDFGLAKWSAGTATVTIEGNILGTPAYMSPEQARGEAAQVDRRSDVYGLGALLYEMLTGRPPFHGDIAAIVHQVIHCEPRQPRKIARDISRDLETICLKAMEKEPERRYPSAQEAAVDLRRYLRGESIVARRASLLEKGCRWFFRHPALAASVLLSATVTIAAIMVGSLTKENYELRGFRPVEIDTLPHGARVALVPIDTRTGEPSLDPASIILPRGATPIRVQLKPGDYLVEAVLLGSKHQPDFAEVHQTIAPRGTLSKQQVQRNRKHSEDDELIGITIHIPRTRDVIAGMVPLHVDKSVRRSDSSMPDVLYVDAYETTPREALGDDRTAAEDRDGSDGASNSISLWAAQRWAKRRGKRLPTAAEYDAIVEAISIGSVRDAVIQDIDGGLAEWTISTYEFAGVASATAAESLQAMRVLKGYGDPGEFITLSYMSDGQLIAPPNANSSLIGCRGVRSGAPRFVKW